MKTYRSALCCIWLLIAGVVVLGRQVEAYVHLPLSNSPTEDIWITPGLGCVVETHSVYYFPESKIYNNSIKVATAGDCCDACRQHGGEGAALGLHLHSSCNIWTFCPREEGCSVDEVVHHPLTGEPARVRLSLEFQECLLQYDKGSVRHLATASFYQNRNVSRPDVAFVSGAPLTFDENEAPEAGGYERYVGVEFTRHYDWPCPAIPSDIFKGLEIPQRQQLSSSAAGCWVRGPLESLLTLCESWEECAAVDYFPGGFSDNPDQPEAYPSGWLKTTGGGHELPNLALATMNPSAATYIKLPHVLPAGKKLVIALGIGVPLLVLLVAGTAWCLIIKVRGSRASQTSDALDNVAKVEEGMRGWEGAGGSPPYLPKKFSGSSSFGGTSERDTPFDGSPWNSEGTDPALSPNCALSVATASTSGGELEPSHIEYVVDKETGEPQLLGRGSFGAVYLARWQKHTLVAIKTVIDGNGEEEDLLLNEAAMLQQLSHPNIVQFLGVCRVPGKLMVATEYMPRGTLAKAMAMDRGPIRRTGWYSRGRQIALDVARGIAFLHDQRIIHLDISSSNVLLDIGWNAKISDVGMSKMVLGDHMQNTMRGTMAYMAVEMYDSQAIITYAVDVYSFGVILNEIVTGETPSKRRGLTTPRVPEDCPQGVVDLYTCCMAQHPSQRPSSWKVVEMLENL
eukprot:jgi/Botrbrau1/4630/Bobra.33_2s0002.1